LNPPTPPPLGTPLCTVTGVAVVSLTLHQLHGPVSHDLSRAVLHLTQITLKAFDRPTLVEQVTITVSIYWLVEFTRPDKGFLVFMRHRHTLGVEVQLHSFLTLSLHCGEWLTSHPGHFTPGKEPRYPLYRRLGRYQNRSGGVWRIKTLALTGSRTTNQPARSE
jgi:hypothetical protein